jgi:alkylhydroperoxidase family enzyme
MPWIKVFTLEEATGFLLEQYEQAIKRAGRIWNIVSSMSQNPPVLKASMDLYGALMHGPSPLSRGQRELLATVVSAQNHCLY